MKKIVLFLGILLVANINTCYAEQATQVNDGRYVIYQHPTFRGDQYLLDTRTGKVWEMAKTKNGETIWQQVLFDCYKEDKTYAGTFCKPKITYLKLS